MTGLKQGDTFELHCAEGYQEVVQRNITCLSTGNWSGTPRCELAKCDDLVLPENSRLKNVTSGSKRTGDSITLTCNDGYKLNGNPNVICQENRNWSRLPTCAVLDCGNPPFVEGHLVRGLNSTIVNSSFSLECDDGYYLVGSSTIYCRSNGKWSDIQRCKPVSCEKPPIPPNSIVLDETGTTFMSVAYISCNEGFVMIGSPRIVCLRNGSWSGIPSCVKVGTLSKCLMPLKA